MNAALTGGGHTHWNPGAGVQQWRSLVLQALKMEGLSSGLLLDVLYQMMTESGGNPNAINLTDCVTLDGMILTRRGWLKHDEVQPGDETIGFDPETGTNRWTQVTRVVHYSQAPVVRIGNSRWHATVTPNHRWVSAPRTHVLKDSLTSCPECDWEPRGCGGVAIHRSKVHGVRKSQQENRTGPVRMVQTRDLKSRDRLILSAPAETGDGLPVTLVEAELLGWIAGDGHVEKYRDVPRGRKRPTISIAQSKPAMVAKLRALLESTPHACYTDERLTRTGKQAIGPRHQFRLDPAYAEDLTRRAGHPKDDVVAIVMGMSRAQREAWLNGFIDAEGHRDGGYMSVSQCYGPVLDAAHLAIYLCGYRPRLVDNKVTEPGWSPSAHISLTRPVVSGSFLTQEDAGTEDVWCVTTELGTWTCEQDGQIFLTGNSNAAMGDPSRGLMQTIMTTFRAYHWPGTSWDIYNPLANIAAAINYGAHNGRGFGTGPGQIGSGHGYASGGIIPEPVLGMGLTSGDLYSFGEHGPETVTPGVGGGSAGEQLAELADLLRENNDLQDAILSAIESGPDSIGTALGRALDGTARRAGAAGMHSTR
jgi:SLT domain-containing protein